MNFSALFVEFESNTAWSLHWEGPVVPDGTTKVFMRVDGQMLPASPAGMAALAQYLSDCALYDWDSKKIADGRRNSWLRKR